MAIFLLWISHFVILFGFEEIGHFSAAKHVVDYFQKTLFGNLGVIEQEWSSFIIDAGQIVQLLQIFFELWCFITPSDVYLERVVFTQIRRYSG